MYINTLETKRISAATTNYTYGKLRTKKQITKIVVHYTGVDGASAVNIANSFGRVLDPPRSAQYAVDDVDIVQCMSPYAIAWHASVWKINEVSIGIEMSCKIDNKTGLWTISDKTKLNTIKLINNLCKIFPITEVVRHTDVYSKKKCPEPFVRDVNQWIEFKNQLDIYKVKEEVKTVEQWREKARNFVVNKVIADGTRGEEPATRDEVFAMIERVYETLIKESETK